MSVSAGDAARDAIGADARASDAAIDGSGPAWDGARSAIPAWVAWLDDLGDADRRVRRVAVEALIAHAAEPAVQDGLIDALADGEDAGRRNAACEALIGCGRLVTARLVRVLAHRDADLRKAVVDVLAQIGDPHAREPLARRLGDPDPNVRGAICDALAVVGGEGERPALFARARDEGEELLVRLSALRALTALGASFTVSALAPIDRQAPLRPALLELLGRSQDPAATPRLLEGLADPAPSIREAAIMGLMTRRAGLDAEARIPLDAAIRETLSRDRSLVPAMVERLPEADVRVRRASIACLGLSGDRRALQGLLEAARDESSIDEVEQALVMLGAETLAGLEAGWRNLDVDLRGRACLALARLGGERAEALLVEALAAEDPGLCGWAARALAEGGSRARLPELVERLARAGGADEAEPEEDGLEPLVDAIAALSEGSGTPDAGLALRALAPYTANLGAAPRRVRLAIARVLARSGDGYIDRDVLALLLRDQAASVRRAAVPALAWVAFEEGCDALRVALVDESVSVRLAAVALLGRSGRREAGDWLLALVEQEDARVAAAALRGLAGLVRERVIGFAEVEPALVRSLASDALRVLAAVDLLSDVGGERAAALVIPLLDRPEPEILRATLECIASHAEVRELRRLVPLIAHPEWAVREAVARAFALRGGAFAREALQRRLACEQDRLVRDSLRAALARLGA